MHEVWLPTNIRQMRSFKDVVLCFVPAVLSLREAPWMFLNLPRVTATVHIGEEGLLFWGEQALEHERYSRCLLLSTTSFSAARYIFGSCASKLECILVNLYKDCKTKNLSISSFDPIRLFRVDRQNKLSASKFSLKSRFQEDGIVLISSSRHTLFQLFSGCMH